ncbi:MAG TPA: zinc-ribbon domain-containing protein [Pyrinomonadaceae bacterium]
MYCPNCGKTNSADQKFCRSCGLRLEQVVQSLAEQLTAPDADSKLVERQHSLDRWIKIIAASTASLFVGAVLWGIIYSIIIVKGEVLAGSIFLAVIIGLVLFALLTLYRESLTKKSPKQPPSLTTADTAKLLSEPRMEPLPSVVEGTTELLTVEKKLPRPRSQNGEV